MKLLLLWKCFSENARLHMYHDWENIFAKTHSFPGHILSLPPVHVYWSILDMLEFKITKWNWTNNDSLHLLG